MNMQALNAVGAGTQSHNPDFFPQLWFLLISLMVFGAYVAWDLHVFSLIFTLDRSYMASLTMALVVVMSVHCGWHIVISAQRIRSAQSWLSRIGSSDVTGPPFGKHSAVHDSEEQTHSDTTALEPDHINDYITHYIDDLAGPADDGMENSDAIVEIHADSVRAPAELGWFFVDLAIRLGLLGTIIGFILIFASLDNINIEGGDDLKNLLIAMSGGMGTALYTTLTGLVGASLLSFQYLILGRQSEQLLGLLLHIRRGLQTHKTSATQ